MSDTTIQCRTLVALVNIAQPCTFLIRCKAGITALCYVPYDGKGGASGALLLTTTHGHYIVPSVYIEKFRFVISTFQVDAPTIQWCRGVTRGS